MKTEKLPEKIFHCFPIALIFLMLGFFGFFAWHYKLIADDFNFIGAIRGRSVLSTSLFFYSNFNGRFFSHLFLCAVFRFISEKEILIFLYRFMLLALFIFSLAHFLKNYLETIRGKFISVKQAFFWSAFITAFLFFFYFTGKLELWFWISATGVYLISIILALNAFAFILNKNRTWNNTSASFLLFFLAGGFSESFAVMYLLIMISLEYRILRDNSFSSIHISTIHSGIFALMISLIINLCSGGIHNRLGNLPHFGFLYAFKNALHSMAFSVLHYRFLPFEILLLVIFILYANTQFSKINFSLKHFFLKSVPLIIFIFVSFYIPCYLLSDIVPDRAASLGYLVFVLFLFDYFIFSRDSFRHLNNTIR
jgi:hypothetical protein